MNRNQIVFNTRRQIFNAILTLSKNSNIEKLKTIQIANEAGLNRVTVRKYLESQESPVLFFHKFQDDLLEKVQLDQQIFNDDSYIDNNIYVKLLKSANILYEFRFELRLIFYNFGGTESYFFKNLRYKLHNRDFTVYRINNSPESASQLIVISKREALFFKNELIAILITWLTSEKPEKPEIIMRHIKNYWLDLVIWP